MKQLTVKYGLPGFSEYEDQAWVEFTIEFDETSFAGSGQWVCQFHFHPIDDTLAHKIKTGYRNRMMNAAFPISFFQK